MVDFGIVDAHCHIFPPLAGSSGFADTATHLLHQQRSMHVHGNQPYRRASDHSVLTARPLWDLEDPSEAGRSTAVDFRVGRHGRFEWTSNGEDQYVQFLPPHMADMSAPAEMVVREMDYAGIATSILQNDHIYGNLAEDFSAAMKAYPERFIGLAQVEEAFAYSDAELARLAYQLDDLHMTGLYFTTTGLFRNGYTKLPDHPDYEPLWREVARRRLTVAWVHSAKSPIGTYEDEMRHLAALFERHGDIRHVLVHGVPTSLYADEDNRLRLPDIVETVLGFDTVSAEILYPIALGGRQEYPYARSLEHTRQLVDRFGAGTFLWGSDMPNVARYCTYRQSLSYIWDHADFLSAEDRRLIFRDNALDLYARRDRAGRAA